MDKAAFGLAIVSLGLSGVAYWRSGGKQDVAVVSSYIEEEIQTLRVKQKELYENVTARTRAAYASTQERMQRMRERLRELRQEASEKLRDQIDVASEQLARLKESVAAGLETMKETTIETARQTQEALAKRVHRLDARVDILQAKFEINRALASAKRNDFDKTDEHLHEAVDSLNVARQTLGDDHVYDAKINAVAEALRQAVAAVKAKAEDVQAKIEQVVTQSDTLLSALEADEQAAEDKAT